MAESAKDGGKERKRDKVGEFLQSNLTKGEMALKHAAGLGQTPNVIPVTDPVFDGPPREVEVGWHPVGGVAGKWLAEDTALGKMITQNIHKYPDPTQHWAVLIGEYAHQLWMDENFHVIYTNEKIKRENWLTFKVGETRFNDDAARRAGQSVIQTIREKQPGYNLITNNCQTYALKLLDAIKVGKHKEFGTSLDVYDRIIGPGAVADLFKAQDAEDHAAGKPAGGQDNTVSNAQHVMDANTTQLDTQEELNKHNDKKKKKGKEDAEKQKEHKRNIFSRFSRN